MHFRNALFCYTGCLLIPNNPCLWLTRYLRAGTSIGANIEEATGGFSRRDFAAKCSIAYKEARESHYWLRLLRDTHCLEPRLAESLIQDADELKRILAAILISSSRQTDSK
ncbi:four helix bundle protein [Hymenobacter telluris]|uniref:four helix bundle protein n=1 Tax=Hymenobacter telluris TaxID=2816474 RepID=UPI001F5E0012|nr:four helix bundle protein [Hymenobacter telluris]